MPQKITEKAVLQCDKGTIESQLTVTSQNFFYIENKAIATDRDKEPNINIHPLGLCKLKPFSGGYRPCMPAPLLWKQTAEKDELNGHKILLDTSFCPCATGGTIKVVDKGHKESHELE